MNNKTLKRVVALLATALLVCSCAFAATFEGVDPVTYDAETGEIVVPFAPGTGATKAALLVKNVRTDEIVALAQFNSLNGGEVFEETIDTTKVAAGDTLAISVGDNADSSTLAATAEYAVPVYYKATYGETVTEFAAGTDIADVLPKEVPTKEATAQYTYTFNKWLVNGAEVAEGAKLEGDITITADFTATVNKYVITWVVGETSTTAEYEYGATPAYEGTPTKAEDEDYTYEFKGWTPEIVAVEGAATYTAEFTATEKVKNYTITFVDEDGVTVLDEQTVVAGETPVYAGETPVKTGDAQYTYTFAGWSPAIAAVTGDATYTATYNATVNEYTVTWVVDGAETTETYEYGATPAFKGSTDKAADAENTYAFTGWTPEIADVTGNATYTANYEATPIVPEVEYTSALEDVTYNSIDGTVVRITGLDTSSVVTVDGVTAVYYTKPDGTIVHAACVPRTAEPEISVDAGTPVVANFGESDGKAGVNSADATNILSKYAGATVRGVKFALPTDLMELYLLDVDGNGSITSADSTHLLSSYAGATVRGVKFSMTTMKCYK